MALLAATSQTLGGFLNHDPNFAPPRAGWFSPRTYTPATATRR